MAIDNHYQSHFQPEDLPSMSSPRRRFRRSAGSALALFVVLASAALPAGAADPEVNLYSYRTPQLMQPLLDEFTKSTGIRVNVVHAEKGLLERLRAEGANSPADLVLTADVGNLNDLVEAGLLQPVSSPTLAANIPAQYRDPDQRWYGLSMRARVIIASTERVKPGEVTTYADLAHPKWKGRVCSRSGKQVYMISLIASQIAHNGEAATEEWLEGVKANLAKKPQGNDRTQAKAIAEGECDVALVNTYYLGLMQTGADDPAQRQWADAVRPVFPDQQGAGTHVNVSGAGVTVGAKNRENAVRLIEYLSETPAQTLYAERIFEYPVKPGVPLSPVVAGWGSFKADSIALAEVAKQRAAATRLVDRVGFDEAGGS
jgi:iron(III) transport system substrate-binding protein